VEKSTEARSSFLRFQKRWDNGNSSSSDRKKYHNFFPRNQHRSPDKTWIAAPMIAQGRESLEGSKRGIVVSSFVRSFDWIKTPTTTPDRQLNILVIEEEMKWRHKVA